MNATKKELLLPALEDRDPNVARAAARMAAEYGVTECIEKIIPLLTSKAWQVRLTAVEALGKLKAKRAANALIKIVGGEMAGLRQRLLACAGLSAQSPAQEGNKEDEEVWQVKRAAALALSRINPDLAETPLLGALESPNRQVIIAAMSGLAIIESEQAGARFVEFLHHADFEVRKSAVVCVGKLRHREAAEDLCRLLQDQKSVIRKEAIIALNHIKDSRALPAIIECMKDPQKEVRIVATVALGNTSRDDEFVVGPLRNALHDSSWEVRRAAVNSLGNLGIVDTMEEILPLLREEEEEIRKAVALCLLKLAGTAERARYE